MNSSDGLIGVDQLVDEFMERQQKGEYPTIEEYCQRHPEMSDEIRDVFEALMIVEELKPGSQDESGTFGGSVRGGGQRLDQVGDYRILHEIGRGGMGVVYEAEQLSLGRRVALKVLPRQSAGNGKSLARFQREAKAAARMHHTNIVPVFDVGSDSEHVFYAMQLIQGQGLDLVIDDLIRLREESVASRSSSNPGSSDRKTNRPAPSIAQSLVSGQFPHNQPSVEPGPESSGTLSKRKAYPITETITVEAGSTTRAMLPGKSDVSTAESNRRTYFTSVAQIGQQTASALSYAHARGIVHRDIKPSNLLLDAAGVVWVTDFGLAKTGDQDLTHTGDILGTIRYMSPERFRGHCDVRADVYSLGITLYELLTLKPAFASADQLSLVEHIRNVEPPLPRSLDPRIPRDLETIVLKSIDKDPKRRYQSADDMADDLNRFIGDEPIRARRVSLAERCTRWSRRNKALAAAFCTVATLLVVIAAGSTLAAAYFRKTANEMTELAVANRELAVDKNREAENARANEQEAVAAKEALQRELYLSDIQEVRQAYHDGSADRVDELLKRYVPIEGETDQRGWEWYYWWRASHRHVRELSGGGSPFYDLAISPDKTWFAIRQWVANVPIYDARTQQNNVTLNVGTFAGMGQGRMAISPDGRIFAAIGDNARVRLWRTDDWSELPPLQHQGDLSTIAISADGLLAAGESSGRVTFWDVKQQSQVGTPLETGGRVTCLAFSPDGDRLATGHIDAAPSLLVWNVATRDIDAPLVETQDDVASLAWTARGERSVVAAGFVNGFVRMWDGETYDKRAWLAAGGPVASLAFSPQGDRLVAGTFGNNAVHVWETDSARLVRTAKGHSQPVWGVGFADDGSTVWSSSEDGTLKTWDVPHSGPFDRLLGATRHDGSDPSLTFSADGQALWRGGVDGPTHHWKLTSDESLPEFHADERHKRAAFSANGRFEVAYTQESDVEYRLQVFRVNGADLALHRDRVIPNEGVSGPPDRLAISDDGAVLAWSRQGSLVLFNLNSGHPVSWTEDGNVQALALSPDGGRLAVSIASNGWFIRLWNLSGEAPVLQSTISGQGPIHEICFSPDGSYLAVALWNSSRQILLCDAATGSEVGQLRGHAGPVIALDFSRDGRLLASGGQDGTVRLWDVQQRSLLLTIAAHDLPVASVAISPDGQTIASISTGGDARLWRGGTEDMQDVNYWAWLAEELKSDEAAVAALNKAIQLAPDDATLYSQRADHQVKREQFIDAITDYQTSLKLAGPSEWNQTSSRIGALAMSLAMWKPVEDLPPEGRACRFTLQQPTGDWQRPEFDDTAWETGGPRLVDGVPHEWPGKQIWIRREFHLTTPLSTPLLFLAYVDDDATVFVNGKKAATATWVGGGRQYQVVPSQVTLQQGRNVIAIHCTNTGGDGGIHIVPGTARSREESLALLPQALRTDPENESLLQQRAEIYSALGNWDDAAADYLAILQIHSKSPSWTSGPIHHSERSRFLQSLAAREPLFDALRRQAPDAHDLWLARGRSLALGSAWAAAAAAYSQYAENLATEVPIESEVAFEIACLQRILHDDEGYRQLMTRIRQQAGEHPSPYAAFVLARTAGHAAQTPDLTQKAVRWGEHALTDDPQPWKNHALGLALFRAGDHDAAIAKLNESLATGWYPVLNHLALALVHHAAGDQARAQEYLREAQRWCDEQLQQAVDGTVNEQAIDWLSVHALLREAEEQARGLEGSE